MTGLNLSMNSTKSKTEVVQLVELENDIVQITMKDEEHCNTFSPELVQGLYKCFDTVSQNPNYKVVILTGYGNYFASGAAKEDLIAIHKQEMQFDNSEVLSAPLNCQIPVISAMQGHAIGGGLVLGLYADLVLFSRESFYSISSMKYGFTPVGGSSLIVTEKLGLGLGQEMMYASQNYRGSELAKRGIPFSVVSQKDVLNHAQKLANQIAQKPRLSLITFKEYLTSEIKAKFSKCVKKEAEMFERTFYQAEVVKRIETIYDESKATISKLHNGSPTRGNKPLNLQSKSTILPRHLQQFKTASKLIDSEENISLNIDKNNQKLNKKNDILSDLQIGKISVNDAENLLFKSFQKEIKPQNNSQTFSSKLRQNKFSSAPPLQNQHLRLFCFHGVGGSGSWFQNWSKSLNSNIKIYPVNLPGRGISSKEKPFTEFLPLIESLGEIISHEIDSPFAFYGHSMGALIGLELAHLLKQDYGLSPIHFFISGCWSPHHTQDMCNENLNQFADLDNLDNLDNLDLNYLGETLDIPPSVIKEGSFLQRSIPIFHADLKLLKSYSQNTQKVLGCPLSAFGGLTDPIVSKQEILEWSHHTNSFFKSQMLPGKHLFIRDNHNKKLILDSVAQDLMTSLSKVG